MAKKDPIYKGTGQQLTHTLTHVYFLGINKIQLNN